MAIIALRAWYLEKYEPISEIIKRPPDLRLSRNSLLKSGLRADFLDDSQQVEQSLWFERYLEGETVEFYIEGSGGYAISNIDLISHEMYLAKQDLAAFLDPVVFFSPQQEYPAASEALQAVLEEAIASLNAKSRLSLTLELSPRPDNVPVRLSSNQLRKIRKSLLFIADGTAIAQTGANLLLPSPNVCVELGYALQNKRSGQILLAQMERFTGQFPFDLAKHQQLRFKTATELHDTLPNLLETLLKRFNLFN